MRSWILLLVILATLLMAGTIHYGPATGNILYIPAQSGSSSSGGGGGGGSSNGTLPCTLPCTL